MTAFRSGDPIDARLAMKGRQAIRQPHPIWVVPISEAFVVKTDAGDMHGKAGDLLAYDADTGHLWPLDPAYVAAHYDFVDRRKPSSFSTDLRPPAWPLDD